ncbi:hypothetical protein M5D96_011987, partial [Drosophila gunungcola]
MSPTNTGALAAAYMCVCLYVNVCLYNRKGEEKHWTKIVRSGSKAHTLAPAEVKEEEAQAAAMTMTTTNVTTKGAGVGAATTTTKTVQRRRRFLWANK